ncbi:dentin sialophosphoprotein-like [Anoplophora glabripennis]|uniref:dentin sialophosphoprotein-like n=1 Tax=Anoplophora glabripennis TaxID=217634 RepID=UPI0008759E18|nr:dentin sialophosphoprotein-like [Anoplophora glabripennis]
MGILPPDFGRDSLGFMNINTLETDRESLGIVQFRESLSFRRESLGIMNLKDLGRESLDSGRESLGILYVKSPDVKFGDEEKRIPDIILSTIEESIGESSNVLDTAFLEPCSRKSSALSCSSSVNPSFNSLSLEGPSRIYSVSSLRNFKDTMNLTYSNSSGLSSIHSPLNKGKIFSPGELGLRSKIQSVPESFQGQLSPLYHRREYGDASERRFWSADRTSCFRSLERSFHRAIDFKEADISSEFHDSVFIEGHILAEKIADGSILNESSVGEVGVLDSTPQPDWPNDLSYNDNKSNEHTKSDTETVFKTVDKMLPTSNILDMKFRISKTDSNSSNECGAKANQSEPSQTSELVHNISDIHHEPRKVSMNKKDSKQILENLSELLNSTNRSDKQKSEGKNLLNSLANLLGEGKPGLRNDHDDSGNSSINEHSDSPNKENHEFFEVLDLRIKSTDDLSSKVNSTRGDPLDLSLKSKRIESLVGKRLSQSCSSTPNIKLASQTEKKNASTSSLDMNKNKTSNSSVASNDSKNTSNVKLQTSDKFKQKHYGSSMKKGPMKAVIPVGDMKKKNNSTGTPEKSELLISSMQSKRTSTPINEPKLKPMAASTPTIKETRSSLKDSKNNRIPLSAAKKPDASNSFARARAYTAASLPRPSVTSTGPILRRNSVSDFKKPAPTLQRRNSAETESGVMSSVTRVRQSLGVPYQQQKQNFGVGSKVVPEYRGKLAENKHLPVARSSNLPSTKKTYGFGISSRKS